MRESPAYCPRPELDRGSRTLRCYPPRVSGKAGSWLNATELARFVAVVSVTIVLAASLVACTQPKAVPALEEGQRRETEEPGVTLVARGRLASEEAMENWKRSLVSGAPPMGPGLAGRPSAAINWTKEENSLELTFDSRGGLVTGSFEWVAQANYTLSGEATGGMWPSATGRKTETYTIRHSGALTGMSLRGDFEGEITGQASDTADATAIRSGSLSGTWKGKLEGAEHITGELTYSIRWQGEFIGPHEVWQRFPFNATVGKP